MFITDVYFMSPNTTGAISNSFFITIAAVAPRSTDIM